MSRKLPTKRASHRYGIRRIVHQPLDDLGQAVGTQASVRVDRDHKFMTGHRQPVVENGGLAPVDWKVDDLHGHIWSIVEAALASLGGLSSAV